MQPVRICRAAAEAHVSGRVIFLQRLFFFHLVGRFCETPTECRLMRRASDTDALQLIDLTLEAIRDTDATQARCKVNAVE
jgi:hypothetical protein